MIISDKKVKVSKAKEIIKIKVLNKNQALRSNWTILKNNFYQYI